MTQEELLQQRKDGKLPVIDIAGHPFYVDLRMGTLRPHDDFQTAGIPIKAFDDFEGPEGYAWLPYDPKRHQLKVIDFERINEIPKDWIIVELAMPEKLDPYGYAREHGFDPNEILEENPINPNLKARIVDWKETAIPELIKRNNRKKTTHKQLPESKATDKSRKMR